MKKFALCLIVIVCVFAMLTACDNNKGGSPSESEWLAIADMEGYSNGTLESTATSETLLNYINNASNLTIRFFNSYDSDDTMTIKIAKNYECTYVYASSAEIDLTMYTICDNDRYYNIGYVVKFSEDVTDKIDDERKAQLQDVLSNKYVKTAIQLIQNGNYTIKDGNICLVDSEKANEVLVVPNYYEFYYDNAVIYNVYTTKTTIIPSYSNWRERL